MKSSGVFGIAIGIVLRNGRLFAVSACNSSDGSIAKDFGKVVIYPYLINCALRSSNGWEEVRPITRDEPAEATIRGLAQPKTPKRLR
jgi:hypothetical protein